MEILRAEDKLAPSLYGSVLAIGNFDGVHLGHQAVIGAAVEIGAKLGAPAGVMTFEPHPRQFFQKDRVLFRLTDEQSKLDLFRQIGVDLAVVVDFDEALAGLDAERFVTEILLKRLNVSHIVTGFDFFFGKGREGTPERMQAFGEQFGFGVSVVDAQEDEGQIYSSSNVRAALRRGDVVEAAKMLGYWWRFHGVVESGDHRGQLMGVPTANIRVADGQELMHGIYAVRVVVDGKQYGGAAYIGGRPSFKGQTEDRVKLEVFLFDFDGDLYGKEPGVEFISYLRADRAFETMEALADQMKKDCDQAREELAKVAGNDPYERLSLGRGRAA